MIAVVVPYFQRDPGVLRSALESVLAQDTSEPVVVLVVDDGSPVPAAGECEGLPQRTGVEIRILSRPNGGTSAARNTGLENAPAETTAVAFLDSDDTWTPDHLGQARQALDGGVDVYMSNWILLHSGRDAHSEMGKLEGVPHEASAWDLQCRIFKGNFIIQELTNPIGRISSLVVRWDLAKDLRFETRFATSGEDIFYRLELARRNPVVAVSTRVEVESGHGINQYDSQKWGTASSFPAIRDRLLLHKLAAHRIRLSEEEAAVVAKGLRAARHAAVLDALAVLRHGARGLAGGVSELLRVDALLPLSIPGALIARFSGAARRL